MKVIELAFCCYAVTDMKRAREFYEGVLNLQPTTVREGSGSKFLAVRLIHHNYTALNAHRRKP